HEAASGEHGSSLDGWGGGPGARAAAWGRSERIGLGGVLDGDPAQLRELGDAGPAAETAMTRRLDPAEGGLRLVVHGGAVDVAYAGFQPLGKTHGAADVAAEHRRRQAIVAVVGDSQRL